MPHRLWQGLQLRLGEWEKDFRTAARMKWRCYASRFPDSRGMRGIAEVVELQSRSSLLILLCRHVESAHSAELCIDSTIIPHMEPKVGVWGLRVLKCLFIRMIRSWGSSDRKTHLCRFR